MSDVYAEAFYHLVWATKQREPMIVPEMEHLLFAFLQRKCVELNVYVHAFNAMPDHVHLVCCVPPRLSVAECVKALKGGAAHFINQHDQGAPLCWQRGYGVLTFAGRDLPRIVSYVKRQKAHHANGTLSAKMEMSCSAEATPSENLRQ